MAKKTLATATDSVARGVYADFLGGGRQKARTMTDVITIMLERKLLELSMNRFEWTGFPDEVNVRWLELALARNALSVFYKDEDYGRYFAQFGAGSGQLNMTGDPTKFIVYGNPFGTKTLDQDDCVPIWANYLRVPDWDLIQIYARRLAEFDRTIEINGKNARLPKILRSSENSRLTLDNFNKLLEDGAPVLKIGDDLNIAEAVEVLDLGVDPNAILNLHMVRSREWNECMTLLGINNANQDKKERLVAAEVSGNDDMVSAIRATNLQSRLLACDQINKKWDLDVTVAYVTEGMAEDVATPELTDQHTPQQAVAGGNN